MKNPEEIVRCLRICRSDCSDCTDDDCGECSYRFFANCINVLLSEAADALAASYSYKKGVNNE